MVAVPAGWDAAASDRMLPPNRIFTGICRFVKSNRFWWQRGDCAAPLLANLPGICLVPDRPWGCGACSVIPALRMVSPSQLGPPKSQCQAACCPARGLPGTTGRRPPGSASLGSCQLKCDASFKNGTFELQPKINLY